MRINFFILFIAFSSFQLNAQEVLDKVIGTVGGELILLSEIEEQFALYASQTSFPEESQKCAILDGIISQKLLLHQSKIDSIEVSDAEVDQQLSARIDQILSYMNNDVQQFEDYYGQPIDQVKKQFKEDLKNQILVERMQSQIMSEVVITPAEVHDFFNSIPKDSLPYFNSEVEIGEIVIKPEPNDLGRIRAKERLLTILDKLKKGEKFEELAAKFSQDPGSKAKGGDLGWAKRGTFVPEFEAMAYKLNIGAVSPVFKSDFGYHILEVIERRGNTVHARHILIKPEITEEDNQIAISSLKAIKEKIENDSITFNFAVKKYSSKDVQSYNNGGIMVNPKTGNSYFEIGDLDPDTYFTIDSMDVGQISNPIQFLDAQGETSFRIVILKSRTTPHQANMKSDYSKIQKAALESKKNEFINQWVSERVLKTYINVEDVVEGCNVNDKWK